MYLLLMQALLTIGSFPQWLGWLGWSVTACVFGSALWHAIKSAYIALKRRNGRADQTLEFATSRSIRRMASRALLLFGGVAAGYMWRDHQLVSNVREYQGVRVVSEINPQKYDMLIPGLPRTYKVDFCHVLKMPPTDCIDIKWEQRFGCKVVNGVGYIRPSKETCPNVQTGRDSSPAAASTAARLETRR